MAESKSEARVDIDKLEADFGADPGNFVPLARAFLERNLPLQAIQVCKRGLKANPNAENGLLALGMSYYHNYDDQHAEMTLKKVLRSSPDSAVAHRTLGEIFLDRGQEQKALSELVRAAEIEPRDAHTRALLEAMEEKPPPLKGVDGQPRKIWLPRQTHIRLDVPKPFWHTAVQILVVIAAVVAFLVWYNHYVDVRVEVRENLKAARTAMPRDNFDDLLKAEKHLDKALELNESEEKAVVSQAAVRSRLWRDHAQKDRKEKLAAHLRWMEEEDLPNPERFATKALVMVSDGKADEADKFLTGIIERAIEKKDIFLNAMVFGARGEARMLTGQVKEAREDFSRAVRFSGDSPYYQAKFAEVYFREGNLPRAIKYFRDAKQKNKGHVYSNLRLAYALIQEGKKLNEANKIITELMDREQHPKAEFSPPMEGMLYLVKAEHALATGNVPDSHTWLAKSLAAYSDSAEAHSMAGRLAALNKDVGKAQSEFATAIKLDPRLPKLYFDRSQSLFELGSKAEAVDKLKEFERHLKPTVAYHVHKGQLLMQMDDLQAAMNEFQKAVKVDELNPDGRFHVALCYQKMGMALGDDKDKKEEKLNLFNQARQWYEDTILLPGGETADVYHMMGRIYLASENPDNALDNLGKSVLMMQKASEPSAKISKVYMDISKVFNYLGGSEGERQEKIYLAKAKALREGKTVEQVEKEFAEQEKKKKKSKRRRRRRRRSR